MIPLFEQYPDLKDALEYVPLGRFPTPVNRLDRLGQEIGVKRLYVKRDDLSGQVYAGNKVRKLEFILGRVRAKSAKEVLTFGYAGSNHATATAVYAKQLGLRSISMLLPQPNAEYVRRNLLLSHSCNAELHQKRNPTLLVVETLFQLLRHRLKSGCFPAVIPAGGSSVVGTIGHLNAALELKHQITRGEIPPPDRIYVALGSMGTAAGLLLGLKAAQLDTRLVATRVVPEKYGNARGMIKLFRETNGFLHSLDASFPLFEISETSLDIRNDFFGERYAQFTEEGMQAVSLVKEYGGVTLDGTYTGKVFASLLDDAAKNVLRDKTILFWNTYNSRDFSETISGTDYHDLPSCFHRYFEQETQPLDRNRT
jgi:1-aminocyclopropane-1-carboxylate deaminase/D-cysteine desulfhydrase-like pyridoxal-dependent ACC family enzyme